MHLSIYLYIYLFIHFSSTYVLLALYKVSLQLVSLYMIFHFKYLAILLLLVHTKICKIM